MVDEGVPPPHNDQTLDEEDYHQQQDEEDQEEEGYRPPVEWSRTVEDAIGGGGVEIEIDVCDSDIEIISDSEEEERGSAEEQQQRGEEEGFHTAPAAQPEPPSTFPSSLENDSRASNSSWPNVSSGKGAAALLGAGPSKLGMSAAPGSSFIKNRNMATTGLKDDAQFIQHGPDGKGGRVTICRGQGSFRSSMAGNTAIIGGSGSGNMHGRGGFAKGVAMRGNGGAATQGPAKRTKQGGKKDSGSLPISAFFNKG